MHICIALHELGYIFVFALFFVIVFYVKTIRLVRLIWGTYYYCHCNGSVDKII